MKLGYSSDNRQDCTHCRFYLKDTPFQNDTAKLQLFQKPTRGWRKFYCNELSLVVCFTRITVNVPRIVINCLGVIASGCGWFQQPCLAYADRRAGGHLFFRPFPLMGKEQRFKADIIGTNAQSGRNIRKIQPHDDHIPQISCIFAL